MGQVLFVELDVPLERLHLGNESLAPVVVGGQSEEEDFGNEVGLPGDLGGVESIRLFLVGIELRLFLDVDPWLPAEVVDVDPAHLGEGCIHEGPGKVVEYGANVGHEAV